MNLITRYELPRGKVATDTPLHFCDDCMAELRRHGGWGIHWSTVPRREATMPCESCKATEKAVS